MKSITKHAILTAYIIFITSSVFMLIWYRNEKKYENITFWLEWYVIVLGVFGGMSIISEYLDKNETFLSYMSYSLLLFFSCVGLNVYCNAPFVDLMNLYFLCLIICGFIAILIKSIEIFILKCVLSTPVNTHINKEHDEIDLPSQTQIEESITMI